MRRREAATVVCGAIGLAAAVLAVGGALRWTAALVTILAALALITLVTSRRGLAGVSPLVAVIGVAIGLTVLQLVPLPDGVIEALHPTGAALRADGARVAGVAPWHALTMDAPGTLRALTFLITLLGVAVIALRFAASERGRLACLGAVAVVCGVTAGIVGLHRLFGATSLYGIYTPNQATPPVLGPLLNPNHLGGLMALGAVVSIGLVMYAKQSMAARGVWGMIALGCLGVALATLSRGAILALGAGLGVTLGALVAQRLARPSAEQHGSRARRRRFLINTLPIGTISVCTLVMIVYTSAGTAAEQLANTSLQEIHEPKSKYAAWRSAAELVEDSPWIGVGRGAFEPSFTRVHPASAFVTFSHVENEYIQAVVEWGIPGALVLATAMGWLAIVAIRRWRDGPLAAAALGGLAAVAIQSNVDFGVELLGLAVPVTIAAATLVYVPLRPLSQGAVSRARVLRLGHLLALAGAAIVLTLPVTRSVAEDHLLLDEHPPIAEVKAAIERHPLDYYAYAIAAETMIKDRDPDAIALLNQALVLHPTHSGLHRFAGRVLLAANHPEQAAVEYAAALRGTTTPKSLLAEIGQRFRPDQAADAIPLDYDNIELVVRVLDADKHGDVALAWLARVVERHPRSMVALELMAALAKTRGDLQTAERAARLKLQAVPSVPATLALAQLLARRDAHRDVVQLLGDVARWRGKVADQLAGWLLLCDASFALKDLDEAIRCLRRLDGAGIVGPRERPELTRRLDAVLEARRTAGILEYWQRRPDSGSASPAKPAPADSGSASPAKPAPPSGSGSAAPRP